MWLYDSRHGYTQKCVVIRLVRLFLRRQPATNTSRWLYVLARGYTWLYIVHVPHSLQVYLMDVAVVHPSLSRPKKTQKVDLCGYTTRTVVIHKSAWLYDSSVSFCVDSLPRIPLDGYTSSPVVIRDYISYTYHIASRSISRCPP